MIKKIIQKNSVLKPFDTFSFEPTFYIDSRKIPTQWADDGNLWEHIAAQCTDVVSARLKTSLNNYKNNSDLCNFFSDTTHFEYKKHEEDIKTFNFNLRSRNSRSSSRFSDYWCFPRKQNTSYYTDIHCDDNVLEISTGKLHNYDKFKNKYLKLCRILKRDYEFIPSSASCLQSEGGCHINVDLRFLNPLTMKEFTSFTKYFYNFIQANPYITWFFLSPYDNMSSNIKCAYNKLCKGYFMTLRDEKYYMELRFFMMPRNTKEFDLHFDFAKRLTEYIFEQYTANKKFIVKPLNLNLTYEQSVKLMKHLCKSMKFDYNRLTDNGKTKLLEMRYELGKNYFI